jgi:methionyl-tRNA formyltransferase
MSSSRFSCYLIGAESLLVRCGEVLLDRGHELLGVVTADQGIRDWAASRGVPVVDQRTDLGAALAGRDFDYLFSITNLAIIPAPVLALPRRGAINFHDGPLPRFGGLYAPAWALIAGETSYAVTWHLMGDQVDAGDILLQRAFPVAADETSLTINTKCYEAASDSFGELVDLLASGRETRTQHVLDRSTFHGRGDRPAAASVVRWNRPAV